jgi:hypothetical protein
MRVPDDLPADAAPRARRVLVADDNSRHRAHAVGAAGVAGVRGALRVQRPGARWPSRSAMRPSCCSWTSACPGWMAGKLCRRVRMLQGDAPAIVAVTGYGQDDDRARSLQAGIRCARHQARAGRGAGRLWSCGFRAAGSRAPCHALRGTAQALRDSLASDAGRVLRVLRRDAGATSGSTRGRAWSDMWRQLDALEQSLEDLVDAAPEPLARPSRRRRLTHHSRRNASMILMACAVCSSMIQ